jgi:hypothetical protein
MMTGLLGTVFVSSGQIIDFLNKSALGSASLR